MMSVDLCPRANANSLVPSSMLASTNNSQPSDYTQAAAAHGPGEEKSSGDPAPPKTDPSTSLSSSSIDGIASVKR